VHHIIARRFCLELGLPIDEIDHPHNLITICDTVHYGYVHPELHILNLPENLPYKSELRETIIQTNTEFAKQGKPYWNTVFNDVFQKIAAVNTQIAGSRGWFYPDRSTVWISRMDLSVDKNSVRLVDDKQ